VKKKLFAAILSVSILSTMAAGSAFAMHDPGGGGGGSGGGGGYGGSCSEICQTRP